MTGDKHDTVLVHATLVTIHMNMITYIVLYLRHIHFSLKIRLKHIEEQPVSCDYFVSFFILYIIYDGQITPPDSKQCVK